MPIVKSEGVTVTERLLADLCEQSFLKLWSYPNPFKDDKKELCDLLAVFDNHVFIFFDRENLSFEKEGNDPQVNWNRWKKKAIDKQIITALGAERYIKSGKSIFLDENSTEPFPITFDLEKVVIHKIIVAHGAKEACKQFSDENISGSIGMIYGTSDSELPFPFIVGMDKESPVHVLDSHNLPIIFSELDTFYDLTTYLVEKENTIRSLESLVYCGEEDLLAHYLLNYDEAEKKHYIGSRKQEYNNLYLGEGEWSDFITRDEYKNKKKADEISYVWDELIQRTCQNTLDGTLLGEHSPLEGRSAIHEMAREPRFHRRFLADAITKSIQSFPDSPHPFMTNLSVFSSFYEDKNYVFLQLKVDEKGDYETEYRPKRSAMLEIACGATKNKLPSLNMIVGIAIDAPRYHETNSEDFLLMDCADWPQEIADKFEKENEGFNFLKTKNLTTHHAHIKEFPDNLNDGVFPNNKVGRNDPCPCGSGMKYKKCCLNT